MDKLIEQLKALVKNVPYPLANMSNAAALLYNSLDDINWAGFYLMHDDRLVLGPFQGKPACIAIPIGKGVCGTAVFQNKTQLVPDVHLFAGHIACDSASKSEIVIPLRKNGEVLGVLDIDSPVLNRFTQNDKEILEQFCTVLETVI